MLTIHVPYFAQDRLPDCEWAEMYEGHPVHPRALFEHVWNLVREGRSFCTWSSDVLMAVSCLVRRFLVDTQEVEILIQLRNQSIERLTFMPDGELSGPWPLKGRESIFEASHEYVFPE